MWNVWAGLFFFFPKRKRAERKRQKEKEREKTLSSLLSAEPHPGLDLRSQDPGLDASPRAPARRPHEAHEQASNRPVFATIRLCSCFPFLPLLEMWTLHLLSPSTYLLLKLLNLDRYITTPNQMTHGSGTLPLFFPCQLASSLVSLSQWIDFPAAGSLERCSTPPRPSRSNIWLWLSPRCSYFTVSMELVILSSVMSVSLMLTHAWTTSPADPETTTKTVSLLIVTEKYHLLSSGSYNNDQSHQLAPIY